MTENKHNQNHYIFLIWNQQRITRCASFKERVFVEKDGVCAMAHQQPASGLESTYCIKSRAECKRLTKTNVCIAFALSLFIQSPANSDTELSSLTRYISPSEQTTEYLFEGVEGKQVWV